MAPDHKRDKSRYKNTRYAFARYNPQGTEDLDHKFIADLVLQILSYVSEKERLHIKERQRQGIEAARNRGKRFGRPSVILPEKYEETIAEWKEGKITAKEAMTRLGMKRTTFYKIVKNRG